MPLGPPAPSGVFLCVNKYNILLKVTSILQALVDGVNTILFLGKIVVFYESRAFVENDMFFTDIMFLGCC